MDFKIWRHHSQINNNLDNGIKYHDTQHNTFSKVTLIITLKMKELKTDIKLNIVSLLFITQSVIIFSGIMLIVILFSLIMLNVCPEGHMPSIVMLRVILLTVVVLSSLMLNVEVLNVEVLSAVMFNT